MFWLRAVLPLFSTFVLRSVYTSQKSVYFSISSTKCVFFLSGLAKLGVKPRAKIVELALAGSDPIMMLAGPIPATRNAFKRSKLTMDDMDIYEVNEAFASVPLAWAKVCYFALFSGCVGCFYWSKIM